MFVAKQKHISNNLSAAQPIIWKLSAKSGTCRGLKIPWKRAGRREQPSIMWQKSCWSIFSSLSLFFHSWTVRRWPGPACCCCCSPRSSAATAVPHILPPLPRLLLATHQTRCPALTECFWVLRWGYVLISVRWGQCLTTMQCWLVPDHNVGWCLTTMLGDALQQCWLVPDYNVGWCLTTMLAGAWPQC